MVGVAASPRARRSRTRSFDMSLLLPACVRGPCGQAIPPLRRGFFLRGVHVEFSAHHGEVMSVASIATPPHTLSRSRIPTSIAQSGLDLDTRASARPRYLA